MNEKSDFLNSRHDVTQSPQKRSDISTRHESDRGEKKRVRDDDKDEINIENESGDPSAGVSSSKKKIRRKRY